MNRQALGERGTVHSGGEQFELFENDEHGHIPGAQAHEGRNKACNGESEASA